MIKGFKIRLYPNTKQESLIWKHIGASRFIWNYMLDLQQKNHENGGKFISYFNMNKMLSPMKKQQDYMWLNEVSNATLKLMCINLGDTYVRFFNGAGHPKFKSKKRSKPSYPVRSDVFRFEHGYAIIEKLGKVKYKSDFNFPYGKGHKFSNVRLSFVNGKYMLSFSMECESQAFQLNNKPMGIDLGIKELAVVAYGDEQLVFHNINKSRKMRLLKSRIRHVQRSISRKYESSKERNSGDYVKTENIKREENKLKKLYAKVSNIHHNYIHQITHKLISLLPVRVTMENLKVSDMVRNRHLSRAIQEQCFYEFIRQMRYKCEWNNIQFTQADRFYPSSKTCSCCGTIKHDLKLSDRTYVCTICGLQIDRDYNAAINLMRYVDRL